MTKTSIIMDVDTGVDDAFAVLFAAMHPDTPWVQAEAFMNALQANGFDAPKPEVDGLASDSKEAAEFTQVWQHNKKILDIRAYTTS